MPNTITKDLGPVSGYAIAVENGYTGTEAEWIQLVLAGTQNAQTATQKAAEAAASERAAAESADDASDSADSAKADALKAEGNAVGKQNDVDVVDGPYYHNNAKYYAEQASTATGTATGAAQAAAASATAAAASADSAEAWAEQAAAAVAAIPQDYSTMANDVESITEFQDYVYRLYSIGCFINTDGEIRTESHSITVYAPCEPNTVYKVSKNAGTRFRIGFTSETPANGVYCTGVIADATAGTIVSALSPENAAYICAYIYYSSTDSGTAQNMINSVRIKKMSAKDSPTDGARADMIQAANMQEVKMLLPVSYSDLGEAMFVSGRINSTGTDATDPTAARLNYYVVSSYKYVQFPLPGKVMFYFYDSLAASGFAERSDKFEAVNAAPVPATSHPYMRIVFWKKDETEITADELTTIRTQTALYTNERTDNCLRYALDRMKSDYAYRIYSINPDGLFTITKGECANTSNGRMRTNAKYARTGQLSIDGTPRRLDRIDGFDTYVTFYSSTTTVVGTFISITRIFDDSEAILLTPPDGAKSFLISFHASDWREITDADVETIRTALRIYKETPADPSVPSFTEAECRAAFVDYMNTYAERIGMASSNFLNASGLTYDSTSCAQDELKMVIAVAGNHKACDIWSTSDRSFTVGGEAHARTISVVNNVIGAEPAGAEYMLLGGKGGSLSTGSTRRKARIGIWDVNGTPVAVAAIGPGQFAYDNMATITQDICRCVEDAMDGSTPTPSEYMAQMVTEGGGYAAVPLPQNAEAYINWYGAADLLTRVFAVSDNASATQVPASTTKTLTMLCVLAIMPDMQEVVTVSSGDISTGSGSSFYAGDKLVLDDALRIMMMESSNTMAELVGRVAGEKLLTEAYKRDN